MTADADLADAVLAIVREDSVDGVLQALGDEAMRVVGATNVSVRLRPATDVPHDSGGERRRPSLVTGLVGQDGDELGVIELTRTDDGQFGRDDQAVLDRLATVAVVRLEEIRHLEHERQVARVLQVSLLPAGLPQLPWAELAACYEASTDDIEVGGDWYDVIPKGWERLVLSIGDVSGHGVHAAAVMGSIRHTLRAYALEDIAPADTLAKMAGVIDVHDQARFATVLVADYDRRTRILRAASAGHLPPLCLRRASTAEFIDLRPGLPIGVRANAAYEQTAFQLHPGDTLLLFTDGLVERPRRPIDEGLDQLREVAAGLADQPLELMLKETFGRLTGSVRGDDVAMLAFRPVATRGSGGR